MATEWDHFTVVAPDGFAVISGLTPDAGPSLESIGYRMPPFVELPTRGSELIHHALDDLTKAENDPHYEIDMSIWHSGRAGATGVCLAGSVMAFSLAVPRRAHVDPSWFPRTLARQLVSLERFRSGDVRSGMRDLGASDDLTFGRWPVTPHRRNPAAFREDLGRMADYLELRGC